MSGNDSNNEVPFRSDKTVPPPDTTQDVRFDALSLYAGLKDIANTTNGDSDDSDSTLPSLELVFRADENEEGGLDQSEPQYFTSTTDGTDEYSESIQSMLDSTDEYQQRRGQRLQEMLNGDNQADNDSARALVNMLGSDDYHQLATTMLDVLQTSEINTMIEMLNDPDRSAEAEVLTNLLTDPENRLAGPFSAQRLLGMLGSTDLDTRQTGERLISMLADEDERDLANSLLDLDDASVQQFLEIYDDPDQEDLANELTDLLTSESGTERRAASGILSMMTSNDGAERFAGGILSEMLQDPDGRDAAITIAGTLDSPQQRMQMLDLLDSPAGERLIRMLDNEDTARSATNLLDLLGSEFAMDRRDGSNLLDMLSTPNAEIAERVSGMSNPQHRHHLTEMLSNPATRAAGTQLLSMLDSPQRRERAAANRFLDSMENPSQQTRDANNRVISQLGNENTRDSARTFMSAFHDEPNVLSEAMNLLQSNPNEARRVATMLGGTPQERNAARTLMEMRTEERFRAGRGSDRSGAGTEGDARGEQPQPPRASDQLLSMLANDRDSRQALTILSSLNSQEATSLMGLRENYPHAFNHMTTMLQNGQQSAVRNFLEINNSSPQQRGMAVSADGRAPAAGPNEGVEQVLRMLNNPDDAQARRTAETLMTGLSTGDQLSSMTRLLNTPGFEAEARRLTEMLGDPGRSSEAHTILDNLSQPAQIRTMLNLIGDENRRRETQEIMRMLPDGSGARLLDMLGGGNQNDRQTGTALLNMLGTDNYMDAQNILSAPVSTEQARALLDLLGDRETASGARQLINRLTLDNSIDNPGPELVRNGANSVLGMLQQGGDAAQAARQIVTMLSNPEQSRQAEAILALSQPEAIRAVMGVLNNPEQRQAAEQIRQLLNSNEPGSAALENLSTVMSSETTANRIIEMLNNPAQQADANTILTRLSGRSQAPALMNLLSQDATRPLGQQLLRMLQSTEADQVRAAGNWLRVLSRPGDDTNVGVTHINEMLADPDRRDRAVAMLRNLENETQHSALASLLSESNSPGVQQLIEMLTSGDRAQINGARQLLELRTGESFTRGRGRDEEVSPTSNRILQMLANPETRAAARDIMSAASSSNQLETLFQMSQNPQYARSLNRITNAMRNPEQANTMRGVLNRLNSPAQLDQMVQIMNDANQTRAVQTLTSILQNDDLNPGGVMNLLNMLASPDAGSQRAGRALLEMLNSDDIDSERNGADILDAQLTPQAVTQLIGILNNPNLRQAASEIMELLREDAPSAQVLFDMLGSTDAAVREQGRRLLSQLDSFSTAPYAIRSLEARVVRSLKNR